jgi:hypothetical protein
MKIDNSLLAPYGSMKFARLATKVGVQKKTLLAPYGSMKFTGLATKVGQNFKIDKQTESEEVVQKETTNPSNRAAE